MATDEYTPTEAKYKGGADERYLTYELEQRTPTGSHAEHPKVKRVYVSGDLEDWSVGEFRKQSGRRVHGVRVKYTQHRDAYTRSDGSRVSASDQTYTKIVEVPEEARNVELRGGPLPERYRSALQDVS